MRNFNVDDLFQACLTGPQLEFVRRLWMLPEDRNEDHVKQIADETGVLPAEAKEAIDRVVQKLNKNVTEIRSLADGVESLGRIRESFKHIKQLTISECLRLAEKDMPVLVKKAYPRKFEVPGGYGAPRRFAVAAMYAMWDLSEFRQELVDQYPVLKGGEQTAKNHHAAKVCASVIEKGVPTYFVSKTIMSALMNTDLPKDFSLHEMPWPMEAMILCLPEGTIVTDKGDFSVIAVSKCQDREYDTSWMHWGEMNDAIRHDQPTHQGPDSACILAISDAGHLIQWECPIGASSIWDASVTKVMNSDLSTMHFSEDFQGSESQDVPKAVFQIILAMLACPDMIEAGVILRIERMRKDKLEPALWKPNFFGRGYRKYDAVIGDPGDNPQKRRIHWRRGHFRHQRVGKGLTSVRIIWIEPVLIGKSELSQTS